MYKKVLHILLLAALLGAVTAGAKDKIGQRGDPNFPIEVAKPRYADSQGPQVFIDEFHHNFHKASGRYRPFVELLTKDGYRVKSLNTLFTDHSLKAVDILVIANPVAKENEDFDNWVRPIASAFTEDEVEAVFHWVKQGGALLLNVDHMPWPGAATTLGQRFGIQFNDGFVVGGEENTCRNIAFRLDNNTLHNHPIIHGDSSSENIEEVRSFCGQGFRIDSKFAWQPIFTIRENASLLLPIRAWTFSDQTPSIPADGLLQGATLSVGLGRVAVFGEAAMFSAQILGEDKDPMGFNHPKAKDNVQFVLNVMHWLSSQ